MDEKKRNRREEYTLRVIRETFLELLRKERVERISVGQLCEQADINRSTFYRHYADIYALLDEICDEVFQTLFVELASDLDPMGDWNTTGYERVLRACTITEENKELLKLLLFRQPSSHLLQKIGDAVFQLYNDQHDLTQTRSAETKLHYRYLISGILGIWQSWLMDDCYVPKATVTEIVLLHIGGVMQVVGDRHKSKSK